MAVAILISGIRSFDIAISLMLLEIPETSAVQLSAHLTGNCRKFGRRSNVFIVMKCIIVPLVKCKTGDLSDVNNYRAISVSTAISKLFEFVLAKFVESADAVDAYQFGFTAGHSTSLCTYLLKRTVDYYTDRASHVFTCFLDFSKAFDKANYWKLFHKLLDDKCDSRIVKLLAYWYACVRWYNSMPQFFTIGNGTRQGVLSPRLFTRYIRDLLAEIVNSGIGCNLGGKMQ
jgi:hypothetical protein